jgi:hypothetical protein
MFILLMLKNPYFILLYFNWPQDFITSNCQSGIGCYLCILCKVSFSTSIFIRNLLKKNVEIKIVNHNYIIHRSSWMFHTLVWFCNIILFFVFGGFWQHCTVIELHTFFPWFRNKTDCNRPPDNLGELTGIATLWRSICDECVQIEARFDPLNEKYRVLMKFEVIIVFEFFIWFPFKKLPMFFSLKLKSLCLQKLHEYKHPVNRVIQSKCIFNQKNDLL